MTTYSVYTGSKGGRVVYVGTTIQKPSDRFRWHKANGKRLNFEVIATFTDADQMLAEEFRLIQLHRPSMNKITKRKQNFNVQLSAEQLEARRGDKQWCQGCLRRHVNAGYTYCMYCGKH